jgi:hypothetical protein
MRGSAHESKTCKNKNARRLRGQKFGIDEWYNASLANDDVAKKFA